MRCTCDQLPAPLPSNNSNEAAAKPSSLPGTFATATPSRAVSESGKTAEEGMARAAVFPRNASLYLWRRVSRRQIRETRARTSRLECVIKLSSLYSRVVRMSAVPASASTHICTHLSSYSLFLCLHSLITILTREFEYK